MSNKSDNENIDFGSLFVKNKDPFDKNKKKNDISNKVHLRVQQRTTRKYITIVEGLVNIEYKKVLKKMRKKFSCNGSIEIDDDNNTIFKLQGDQRNNVRDYLITKMKYVKDNIIIHGV